MSELTPFHTMEHTPILFYKWLPTSRWSDCCSLNHLGFALTIKAARYPIENSAPPQAVARLCYPIENRYVFGRAPGFPGLVLREA